MAILETKIDVHGETFATHREEMLAAVAELREIEQRIRAHSEKAASKFHKRGQLIPRERVNRLLDRGRPFLELSSLAGFKMHDDNGRGEVAGGGNVVGIGFVSGVRCMVVANDAAIKGGSVTPMGLKKSLRAQEVALENRLPVVSLVESGGANLLYQSELFVDGGKIFCNMARLSAEGIPQVTVVHGSSTAGGAYMPGLSDYVIAVRDRAQIFLAGPPLVKAALGEDAEEEELGGALMHASVSGTAEYLADDDAHGIAIAREIIGRIGGETLRADPVARAAAVAPRYDPDELAGVVPFDPKQPYDVREVIARVVDASDFLEFKALYGPETICGHARVEGHAVGVVGNNGPIQPEGSVKAAQFIQLCSQAGVPIVYLMNTTGYMVGKDAEQRGAIKHGSKMIQAVSNATVPQFTFVIGGGYGAGNYGMCGRAYDPRFIFAWPNSRVAVMGGEQAATVMKIITRAKFARSGTPIDEEALDKMTESVRTKLDMEARALFATARIWDDGIIDPRDTRRVLAMCLDTCRDAERRVLRPNSFGVARG
jgi:geranyl-CoA carboxylase beta subunit